MDIWFDVVIAGNGNGVRREAFDTIEEARERAVELQAQGQQLGLRIDHMMGDQNGVQISEGDWIV